MRLKTRKPLPVFGGRLFSVFAENVVQYLKHSHNNEGRQYSLQKVKFETDYQEGASPEILERLISTNLEQTSGYGYDSH